MTGGHSPDVLVGRTAVRRDGRLPAETRVEFCDLADTNRATDGRAAAVKPVVRRR